MRSYFLNSLLILACSTTMHMAVAAEMPTADLHAKLGLPCETCHKTPDTMPDTNTCRTCHDADAVVKATEKVKPQNPHTSPHYGKDLDCVNCHIGHEASQNFCDQCHQFGFKVP